MRLCNVKMCLARVLLIVTFICTINCEIDDQFKVVETANGLIRGIRYTTLLKSRPYYSFRGIPYAKPPVDDLRFKAPEPIEAWTPNVLDAFQYGNICIQPGKVMPNPLPQSEDCLTLNIFVPADIKPNDKLAVLFYIHGGGFTEGAGDSLFYGPDFIIEKDTILVTINYRLGLFGFLSLNLTEYSGNMGLKDQQLALKWISENIEQFGGDSKRITIFGHSAGGASTNYQILSAESRKYFQNAIPMSGSVESLCAVSPEPNHVERAFQIAKDLGKPQNTLDDLIEFLKTVPAETLNMFALISLINNALFTVTFAPTIERPDAKHSFLIDIPKKIYESSEIEVNAMFTVVSNEAMSVVPKTPEFILNELNTNFNVPMPFKEISLPLESEEHRSLAQEVRKFYFGDEAIDEQAIPTFVELISDINVAWPVDQSVNALAAHSKGKTYHTWFSVDSKLNMWKKFDTFKRGELIILPGAGHGDELCYLFRCDMAQSVYDEIIENPNDEDSQISLRAIENISTMFTNFAKYGQPSYENVPVDGLLPIQSDQFHFITINNDGVASGLNPHQKIIEFWKDIERRAAKYTAQSEDQKRDEL